MRQQIEGGGDFLQAPIDVAADDPDILDRLPLQVVALFAFKAQHQVAAEKDKRQGDDGCHHHQIGADGGRWKKIRTAST
ncbi:hypothetical protein D3C87_1758400 [compost metagenome]